MIRMRIGSGIAVAVTALALATTGGAGPQRDELIRPGVGIGKIALGMTQAQVRGAMGQPESSVTKRGRFGRVTLQWQFGIGSYVVEFAGPVKRLRVTAVSTTFARERTREGFGAGTPENTLLQGYGSRLACTKLVLVDSGPGGTSKVVRPNRRECRLGADGSETVFVLHATYDPYESWITPTDWVERAKVFEVVVRSSTSASA